MGLKKHLAKKQIKSLKNNSNKKLEARELCGFWMFCEQLVDQNYMWNKSTVYTETLKLDGEIFYISKIWKDTKRLSLIFILQTRIQTPKP